MNEARKMLFRALEKSDLHMVRAALAKDASARFEGGDHRPPLMVAIDCNRDDLEILDELNAAGAAVHQCDPCGHDSILHWATGRKTPSLLNWCLAKGAEPDTQNAKGLTPLMWVLNACCQQHEVPEMRAYGLRDIGLLLDAHASAHLANNEGQTALHYAAKFGCAEAVGLLLRFHAPVDTPDSGGATPLMLACDKGWSDIAAMLIAAGASVSAVDNDGNTALHLIAGRYPENFREGHLAAAESLITAGAKVNVSRKFGFPPIYHCASNGNVEMAGFLLRNGADPDSSDGGVLQSAVFFEYDAIVSLLLNAGADADYAYGEEKRTPLHVAAHEGYLFGAIALLDKGASIDTADIDGETPLMTAVRRQHVDLARELLERGADVLRTDHYGNTPLSLAQRRGNAELIALIESKL